jgi:hypothetical protein
VNVTFFDLLGIDPNLADRAAAAGTLLAPLLSVNGLLSLTQGVNLSDDSVAMIGMLQQGLSFTSVRPGVDPHAALGSGPAGQIGIAADMNVIGPLVTQQPFYLRSLPDHGVQLMQTDAQHPAQLFFVSDGRGHELIIDRLPVKILLKSGLASQLTGLSVMIGTFDVTKPDSFAYQLGDDINPCEIDCFIRLRLTPENDVIMEPSVPISFGPVRWMGMPATAVYDIQLIPSPNRREYFEWSHNDIGSFFNNPPAAGAVGFRSIEVDFTQPPFSDLRARCQQGAVHIDNLELVLEDVVVPVSVPILPIPSHGTFGFRRKITDRTDIAQAYSLSGAPVQIPLYKSGQQGGNGGTSTLTLQMEEFFFRTGDLHAIDAGDQPQVQFQAELIFQTTAGNKAGATMGIDAEWTFTAGLVLDIATTPAKFTIADTTIGLVGLKLGVSAGRLGKGIPFKDSFELLADLYVTAVATGSDTSVFKIRSLTGKQLSIVAKDIGWKLGHPSLDGLQFPDGMQLIFANTVKIIIEEMGWVEEPNGTPYFSFSGGIAIGAGGGNAVKPDGTASDSDGNGFGIRVRRLRFRTNEDASQPVFKLDGVFLKLHYGPVDVEGFGYISDYTDSGWAIKEWGFGAKVALKAIAMTFSLSAEFVKGNQRNLTTSEQFDYFLAAMSLGFLPAGPVGLYDLRALVADNMAPNLDATFPDGEGMALLKWHQNHDHALNLPANRTLADWIPERSAFALGVGCGFSLNGCGSAVHLDIFIFFAKSQADTGLLIVGDLFLLKNPKPIAFVAIEYDIDKEKFGVMAGVNLTLADFASGAAPDWVARVASLSGTLYFGNQPWSFAVGQLADQSTWLALRVDWNVWITVKFMVGIGLQITDGGPKGFGFVITLSAGANWGIGAFVLWGTFGFIIGTWKTGSTSMGAEIWVQLGFKINLFWVFSFGAEIGLKLTYLGKHPWYLTLHGEIKIDTPWFMPDVTFTIDKTWQESLPFDTATITQCLSSASGIDPTAQQDQALLVPGLAGALGDAAFLYTFNQLNGLTGILIPDPHVRDDIPVVSVDATIAIGLAQPSSNDSLVATSTGGTPDPGVQQVQDMTVRYGLESIAVRRAPQFGPTAGVWTDFVTDAQTGFSIGGTAPEALTFTWDVDTRADGKLAPKRLLVNSSSPYSFATQGAQNDAEAAASDPGFPCCKEERTYPKPHMLEFSAIPFGDRTPRSEQFTDAGGWWTWALPITPVVGPGDPVFSGEHVAWVFPAATMPPGDVDLSLGAVDLSLDPAFEAALQLAWDAYPAALYFEAYDGPQLIGQQVVNMTTAGSTELLLTANPAGRGISRLTIRLGPTRIFTPAASAPEATTKGPIQGLALFYLAYITMAELKDYIADQQRCHNPAQVGPPGSDASGKLAFLPNHDYEIVVTSTISVSPKSQGKRTLQTAEALYFRTKGLPGLNACPNVGDDIRRHVETSYPARRSTPLYRQEPCVVAFENSLSSVLPVDRTPGPNDPPEKAQMFPLELNVDRVVSLSGLKRLTVPSNDWILAHRANPYPPIYVVAQPGFAISKVRLAHSGDPLLQRYEAVQAAVPTCGPPTLDHASQVLLHEPIDENGNPGPWEAGTGYRATIRQQGGPFAERTGFDVYDLGAFIMQADGGANATLWSVDGSGNLVGPAAAGGRNYASCGDLDWDHLQVHARIDLATANAAGIAVGVGDGTPVPQCVLATVEPDGGGHSLVVRIRDGAGERELGRAAVTVNGPFLLQVIAYDDVVRAIVGTVSVDGPRGAVREGRVALLADGPAAFAGIAIGALDVYSFEFVTSKYASFAEHLGSYDGTLPAMADGAFGGTPTPVGTVLAAHAADLPAAMMATADPQERQRLFDSVAAALGVGLRANPVAVTVTRLTDSSGTFGLAIESPEPISLTREVTIQLIQHVRVWVPGPVPLPVPVPVITLEGVTAQVLRALPHPAPAPVNAAAELNSLTFGTGQVTAPRPLSILVPGDQLARVAADPGGNRIDVYDPPLAGAGLLRESMTTAQAALQPAYKSLAHLPPGTVVVVRSGGVIGPIGWGHWVNEDIVVPVTAVTNGGETRILLLSGTPLGAGSYTLQFVLDRDRWPVSVASDPEQHYHDQATIPLHW